MSNVVTSSTPDIMKADSGATITYLKSEHKKYLHNVEPLLHGPHAILPNNTSIQASASGNLQLHSKLKHSALIFPELHSESLLSIGQVCDDGCIALFDDKVLKIYRNK